MKIVLINNLYGRYARGGAEQAVATIADGLVQAGHEVVVVSTQPITSPPTPSRSTAGRGAIRFYPWNIISYYNLGKLSAALRLVWHLIDMFNIQSYFKIKKILRKEKPDLVMTHNLTGVGFLTPLAIHRSRRVKESNPAIPRDWIPRYMHTLHDIQLLHPSGLMLVGKEKKVDGLFARVYQWYNKKLFASLDIVISPSEWLMKMHADRGFFQKAKCVVMANSVNTSPSPSLVRRGDDDGKFIFLYVGQIEKHKGVELLIKEFIKLQRDNSELWIVGEGGESEKLEVRSKKLGINARIKFLGKKNYDEIRGLMQKANCLVVPSLCYENQPTVIIEARQNNLPVIASDIGGIPEILKPEFLFKAGDREELIKKMKWVMENYDRVKKMQSVETQVPTFAQDYIEKLLKL